MQSTESKIDKYKNKGVKEKEQIHIIHLQHEM